MVLQLVKRGHKRAVKEDAVSLRWHRNRSKFRT